MYFVWYKYSRHSNFALICVSMLFFPTFLLFSPFVLISSVQSLSPVWLFATPWTAARQASLSITISRSLLTLMSIKSVMPSNHLILCCPLSSCSQSFPASGSLSVSQLFALGGQRIGASASASFCPMNIQGWFYLDWLVWSPCCPRACLAINMGWPIYNTAYSLPDTAGWAWRHEGE